MMQLAETGARIAATAAAVLAIGSLPAPAEAAPRAVPTLPDLDLGSLSPATPSELCTFTFYQPGGTERTESAQVSVSSAGEGATTFVFRTESVATSPYTQAAAVTWSNLDTGLSGGGYDSRTEAQVEAGTTTITLPAQNVGKGRVTVVASVSNTRSSTATSYDDCTAEYTAP